MPEQSERSTVIRFADRPGVNLDAALNKEWLETNGLGGFASSTIVGLNTRRYHGLLTAATHPPVGRVVMLAKFEETLVIDGTNFDLSCNQYPGVIHPQGNQFLEEFRLDPFPVFVYRAGGVTLEKSVFMLQGENTTVVQYGFFSLGEAKAVSSCRLELRPLIAFRDYHALTHRNDAIRRYVKMQPGCASIAPYVGIPALQFAHDAASLRLNGEWYLDFEYRMEQERGLDMREDLFCPFSLQFDLTISRKATVIASTGQHDVNDAAGMREREIARRRSIVEAAPVDNELVKSLCLAADQFIVKRGDLQTVIAGYHWFSDWGRDTMIALPGLTLTTGWHEIAKNILRAFASAVDQGMLPNRWPDAGETPEYNTVDATLWFFEAAAAVLRHTGDQDLLRELFPILKSIIEWHIRGTRFGIHVNDRGLIECGETGTQLTWMDAKVGDFAVTPRKGMPVEIQALWYNALRIMQDLAGRFEDGSTSFTYGEMADVAKRNFGDLFWNEDRQCLYDVVDGESRDAAIRPNQIFCVSLPHPILEPERARQVVKRVERDLLTPRGLRSLAPSEAGYRPRYEGNPWSRDTAYHQGTVWPWLLGPFITAYLRAHDNSDPAREQVREWLQNFASHLNEAGLGTVSEIFDADAPHSARGCIAQAWSVGEILRVAVEIYQAANLRPE